MADETVIKVSKNIFAFHQNTLDFKLLPDVVAKFASAMTTTDLDQSSLLPVDLHVEGAKSIKTNVSSNGDFLTEGTLEDDHYYRHHLLGTLVVVISYTLIFVIGVIGNTCVLFVGAKIPKMRTVTNYFIFNLAFADLLVVVFCVLPTLIINIITPWVMGWFLCKTVSYIQGVAVCASIYSLVAISLERCIAIRCPLRLQMTKAAAWKLIGCIWIWSMVIISPWAFFFQITKDPSGYEYCQEIWPEGWNGTYYFLFGTLLCCYCLPLVIIAICYWIIWLQVWRRPVLSETKFSSIELIHQKAKVGVLKMLVAVVIIFAVSWLPLYSIATRIQVGPKLAPWEDSLIKYGLPVAQWLGSFNSCINPVLYGFLSVKFRRCFSELIFGPEARRRPTPHHRKPNTKTKTQIQLFFAHSSSNYEATDV